MNQAEINEAVKNCMREALGQSDPLAELQHVLDSLEKKGWSHIDLDAVKQTCIRMLAAIYDVRGLESDGQK